MDPDFFPIRIRITVRNQLSALKNQNKKVFVFLFRRTESCVTEITNLVDRPEYLVFSPKYNLIIAKV